jgi:hypothetical protein
MRRSICIVEPHTAFAGEINTWKFTYTTASNLPKGAKLRFDIQSKGRLIDWQVPSIDLKQQHNVIWASIQDSKPILAKEIDTPDSVIPIYEFTLPSELKTGSSITFHVGAAPKLDPKEYGTKAQENTQRRKIFNLYIDSKGDGRFDDPEIFSIDIKGGKLYTLHILAPSFVVKNKRFDVVVRFEDQFGNLTNNADEGTLIDFSHDHLRENLSWKLFVPETGFVTLPNLYFNDPGVYKIILKNLKTKQTFISSPIKCFLDSSNQLFWGLLHGESDKYDSTESIESCLRHFRDEKALNFFSTSCFESTEETSNELWKSISQHVIDFNEEERFSSFLGMQWKGEDKVEGLRNFVYLKDAKPILRQKDAKTNTLKKIYKTFSPKEFLSIPSFTMGSNSVFDFTEFQPEYERVVEIYNAWGSSECTASEGNLRPIHAMGKKGVKENSAGSIKNALLMNYRFGFVAGGLDDRDFYNDFYEGDQTQYSAGLTAIMAKNLSRDSLFEALYNRSCYATTGARIIIGFFVSGAAMGSELDTKSKPGLAINRHLSAFIAGTDLIQKVEIIRNGDVLKNFSDINSQNFDFTFDDLSDLQGVVVDGGSGRLPFVFYYMRVLQKDGHIAWSSPIWIDFHGDMAPKKVVKKSLKTK